MINSNSINQTKEGKELFYSKAKTNNSKCAFCNLIIPKDTPIIWYWDKFNKKKATIPTTTILSPTFQELDIQRKICYRCLYAFLDGLLNKHKIEIIKINKLRRKYRKDLKSKKCRRAIDNYLVLTELEKEDYEKNFHKKF
jgi:hypothetical protein